MTRKDQTELALDLFAIRRLLFRIKRKLKESPAPDFHLNRKIKIVNYAFNSVLDYLETTYQIRIEKDRNND